MSNVATIAVPVPEGKAVCTMCGKLYDKPAIVCRDSDLCDECSKKYKDMAFIYCPQCNAVVSRIQPGETNGTFVGPGDIIVVDSCPQCNKNLTKSNIVKVVRHGSGERLR